MKTLPFQLGKVDAYEAFFFQVKVEVVNMTPKFLVKRDGKKVTRFHKPEDPWDWDIYLREWLILMVNVGKYTSPMDPMGNFVLF